MKLILIFPLTLLTTLFAEGRLGETEAQCLQRYGPSRSDAATRMMAKTSPLIKGTEQKSWNYQGWSITAAFHPVTGQAVRVRYIKQKPDSTNPFIQDYEFKAILDGNGGAANWKLHSEKTGLNLAKALEKHLLSQVTGPTYRRITDGATVQYSKTATSVTLDLPEARQFEAQRMATKEAEQRANVPKF